MELEQIAGNNGILRYVRQGGNLQVNIATGEVQISLGDVILNYGNRNQYENPTLEFLDDAIRIHQCYAEYLGRRKLAIFEKLRDDNEWLSDIEIIAQSRVNLFFVRIYLPLVRRQTLKANLTEISSEIEAEVKDYEDCKKVIEYGRKIMQDILDKQNFSEGIRQRFERVIKSCENILFMYSDIIERLQKTGKYANEVYRKVSGKNN